VIHVVVFTGRQRSCKAYTTYRRQAVCPSVCLSHAEHWVKTTQARITKSSPADSPRTLVFGIKNHSEIRTCSPRARALNESGVGKIRNFQPITGRISETGSRMRPFDWCQNQRPWITLNGRYALCCKKKSLSKPTTKIWMKIDPYYQRQKCRPLTLVSGDIKVCADIRWGSLERGRQTTVGWSKTLIFRDFGRCLRHLRKWG